MEREGEKQRQHEKRNSCKFKTTSNCTRTNIAVANIVPHLTNVPYNCQRVDSLQPSNVSCNTRAPRESTSTHTAMTKYNEIRKCMEIALEKVSKHSKTSLGRYQTTDSLSLSLKAQSFSFRSLSSLPFLSLFSRNCAQNVVDNGNLVICSHLSVNQFGWYESSCHYHLSFPISPYGIA